MDADGQAGEIRRLKKEAGKLRLKLAISEQNRERLEHYLDKRHSLFKASIMEIRAAKEQAEAAVLMKDKFISLISHDLRSPLSTIILLQKVTMSRHKDSQCAECKTALGKSVGICETMLQMTDDLLDSARIQGGNIRLSRKICNIRDICNCVMEDLGYLAAKKEVILKNAVPSEARFYVDRVLLQRVTHNLVTNALKFSNKGGMVTMFMPGGQNVLAVKDAGTGISKALLPDLFKYEVKTTTPGTSGEQGTGFGLPMSMDIVKAHGGTIRVTSEKGEGTTFFVEMPDMKPLVLVADDDDVLLFTIRKYLENMGAEMVMAKNGAEAFTIAMDKEPALIITDLKMPVMDGFVLLQKLKGEAMHSHIPVIIITSSTDIAIRKKAFEYRADDFIIKPLSEPDFMPRIGRFIAG